MLHFGRGPLHGPTEPGRTSPPFWRDEAAAQARRSAAPYQFVRTLNRGGILAGRRLRMADLVRMAGVVRTAGIVRTAAWPTGPGARGQPGRPSRQPPGDGRGK